MRCNENNEKIENNRRRFLNHKKEPRVHKRSEFKELLFLNLVKKRDLTCILKNMKTFINGSRIRLINLPKNLQRRPKIHHLKEIELSLMKEENDQRAGIEED